MSKLNNIDDAIRNSFENFEVPFDASLWNNIDSKLNSPPSNELTSFDKKVQESVSGHEVAYNPAAWTAVESQLTSSYSYTKWFLAAGLIGLVSLGIYFMTDSEKENNIENKNQSKEKLAENNSTKNNSSIIEKENETESNSSENEKIDSENILNNSIENKAEEKVINEVKIDNSIVKVDPNKNNPIVKNEPTNSIVTPENKWSIASPSIIGEMVMCEGEEAKLVSSLVSDKVNIQWILNGIPVSNSQEITLKNLNAGTHELELVHSPKSEFKNQCLNSELKKTVNLTVKENPRIDFKYAQEGDAYYPETKFNVLSDDKNVKYNWIVENKSFVGEEMVYLFNNKGNYPVKLLSENSNGCSNEVIQNIEISTDYNLLAPNSFSPNFDGINDDFIPEALKYLNLPFKMVIYNRQNSIIFQTNRSDLPWDGRNMNNGETCGQGAYLWIVELTNKEGKVEQYSGTITLLK